jgi:hypothetical protein
LTELKLEDIQVVRNEGESRFEAIVDGQLSRLDYVLQDDRMVITHVIVHPELRGAGMAGKLMLTGVEFAQANSLRVVPMCRYANAYMRRNPQWQHLLKK